MKRVLVAVAATAALLVSGPPAVAEAGGGDNVVMVFNENDGSRRARSNVMVSPTGAGTVDSENVAYAKSSCTDCRTVAVAMQAVLITGNASTITPRNAAVAVNEECVRCQTMAAAYQYVVTTGGPVYLSQDGHARVNRLRQEIAAVAASGQPFPEIDARLDALFSEFKTVMDEEVRRAGGKPSGTMRDETRVAAA